MGQVTVTLDGDEFRLLRKLDKIVQKEKQLGDAAANAGKKSKRAHSAAQKVGERSMSQLKGMVLQYASIGAAIGVMRQAYSAWQQDLAEGNRLLREQHSSFKELMFMGDNWKDSAKVQADIRRFGVRTGIKTEELNRTETEIASRMSWAGKGQRAETREAAVLLAKTSDLSADSYVGALAKMQTIYRKMGGVEAGNLLAAIAERAAVPRDQVAEPLAKALAGGATGKISGQEVGGLFSIMTRFTSSADVAGSNTEMMMRKMMTMNPKVMKRLGITEEMSGLERLGQVRAAGLSDYKLKQVVGERVFSNTKGLFKQWGDLQAEIKDMETMTGGGRNLLQEKVERVRKTNPVFAGLEAGERLKRAEEREHAKQAAQHIEVDNFLKYADFKMREQGMSPGQISMNRMLYDATRFMAGDDKFQGAMKASDFAANKLFWWVPTPDKYRTMPGFTDPEYQAEREQIGRGLGSAADQMAIAAEKMNSAADKIATAGTSLNGGQ